MNDQWLSFLQQQHIQINKRLQSIVNKSNSDNTSHVYPLLCDLSYLGLISAQGTNAAKFLQGQLSCDMLEVHEQHSQLAVHCNHKGRIIATTRVFQWGDTYYLATPRSMVQHLLTSLEKYAVFSKVTLTDVSDEWIQLGFYGDQSQDLFDSFKTLPIKEGRVCSDHEKLAILVPGSQRRIQTIGKIEAMEKLWLLTLNHVSLTHSTQWELLDIQAGISSIYPENTEVFTPHQINYQLINGICFTKGCYTGQEVIARMHYLGKLKQQTYRLSLASLNAPCAGDKLFNSTEEVGTILLAAPTEDHHFELLAVMKNDAAIQQEIYYGSEKGTRLKLLSLPYPLTGRI